MTSEYTLHYLTAQTSMSQTWRNFSLKFNNLSTFSEITQGMAMFKTCAYMVSTFITSRLYL